MSNRHKLDYPPYYFLTSIKIASKDYDAASKEIQKVKKYLPKSFLYKTFAQPSEIRRKQMPKTKL